MLLATIAAFTSCKKDDGNGGQVTSLTISKDSLIMSPGDDAVKISVKTNTGEVKTVVWESSDSKIATCKASGSSATINAIDYGTAYITCSLKDDPSVKVACKVMVENKLNRITFERATMSQRMVIDSTKVYEYGYIDIEDEGGKKIGEDTLWAYLAETDLNLLSKGFTVSTSGEWVGEDKNGCYMACMPAYVYIFPHNLNPKYITEEEQYQYGRIASLNGVLYETSTTKAEHKMIPGTINEAEYVRYMKKAFDCYDPSSELPEDFYNYRDTAVMQLQGAALYQYIYSEEYGVYYRSSVPCGVITYAATNLLYSLDGNPYMYSIKSDRVTFNPFGGWNNWGLDLEEDEITGKFIFKSDKMVYGPTVTSKYILPTE